MNIFETLKNLYTQANSEPIEFENHEKYSFEVTTADFLVNNKSLYNGLIKSIPPRDKLILDFKLNNNDPVTLNSNSTRVEDFFQEVKKELKYREDEDIEIKVIIYKNNIGSNLSIYSLREYTNYLANLSIEGLLLSFKKAFSSSSTLNFCLLGDEDNFHSKYISFGEENFLSNDKTLKKQRLDSIKEISHYNLINQYQFIPEDFKLIEESSKLNDINLIFKKLLFFQSITTIFDISNLKENTLDYVLNGYKSHRNAIKFSNVELSSAGEFFNIYQWIYDGGNLSDKIGLARNIISLHISTENKSLITDNTFHSIRSSFEIYLKENIEQYINLRTKISDRLIELSHKANAISEKYIDHFQKSIFTFLTFFSTVLVVRLLNERDFENLLTYEATILSFSFLGLAIIFLAFSNLEVHLEKNRLTASYENLKERFQDLLTQDDILRILNDDKDFNAFINHLNKKTTIYTIAWIAIVLIFLIGIIFLSEIFNANLTLSISSFIVKLIFSIF